MFPDTADVLLGTQLPGAENHYYEQFKSNLYLLWADEHSIVCNPILILLTQSAGGPSVLPGIPALYPMPSLPQSLGEETIISSPPFSFFSNLPQFILNPRFCQLLKDKTVSSRIKYVHLFRDLEIATGRHRPHQNQKHAPERQRVRLELLRREFT